MRAAFLSLLFSLPFLCATPASAGDIAELEILGFSADARVFAFEEFGVQDGSGFPYAYRYYIDTTTDKYLPNTPIRVRLEDDGASVDQARQQAFQRGEKVIREAQLARNRGLTAGLNPVTELSADPHRIVVNPRQVMPPIDGLLEFRLEEMRLEQPERCRDWGETVGFRLLRIDPSPGGRTVELHKDASIPLSRGCPTAYRFGGVQTFFPDSGRGVYAVLIAIEKVGFEGPDFRWIAVTGRL